MSERAMPPPEVLEAWLDKQRERDPELYRRLVEKRRALSEQPEFLTEAAEAGTPEGEPASLADPLLVLETIVRDGRPALFVKGRKFTLEDSFLDDASSPIIDSLESARSRIDPMIPLVGRIDVSNHATGLDFLGTGWLVAEDIVITNRHVAELLARRGLERYEFLPGRFGDPIAATMGYGHEVGGGAGPAARIIEVVYIEPSGPGPDIAFIRVERHSDGTTPKFINIASADLDPGQDVVVIGYPARAPASTIPDQQRMDRLYGGVYDVKRAAPGKVDDPSRGWMTHDCTTLGGNSGSVILDMATGKACALHFAGLYLVENYAVPASTLRQYLGRRPWPYRIETTDVRSPTDEGGTAFAGSGSISVPLTLTISLDPARGMSAAQATGDPEDEARKLASSLGGGGVLAVRPGVIVEDNSMIDETCLVVAAHPDRIAEVRSRAPKMFGGMQVQVRPASLEDQLGLMDDLAEAPRSIAYDDDARQGRNFRLDWVHEPMTLRLHVGPERSFEQLADFVQGAEAELISAIYQFYADHVRAAIATALDRPALSMTLVADPQTRDHSETPPDGQFDRSETFAGWSAGGRFDNIYVPEGNSGLVDNAYHIKVTVRDGRHIWLSSGNWTRSSQPKIAAADRDDPKRVGRAGNREWHVIAQSESLAERFRNHILQDRQRSRDLGGRPEAIDTTIFVDVPETVLEAIELEAAPDRLFEPEDVEGELRVRPLLTPDLQGGIYCDAVLELIASARRQLLFQNQYIKVSRTSSGRFGALVDALARASQRLEDCRIILRSDGSGFWDQIAELRRRGVDVANKVRRLAHTHTKGIIVDGRQVLAGSHNWSQSGVTLNRDASLIIDDRRAAAYFAQVFETDWKRASPLTQSRLSGSQEAPRLASGNAPPPGFRRMPLSEYLEG